ncbi:ankyrin [Zopfia rhizophila CBS 207.26]|uniref:Ankyrin n=1 Tax=Zopfia rhizophila CBS 207.26 TaxID=1314779 RepID=A0A6A6E870_9PEZI|nr:ankyrin [Zopfia rhizophila CBS 207.26]
MAASAGEAYSVRFLLENGCTHDIVHTNGKTLVELAIRWGNPSVMQALQDFGAKFDSVDSNSDAPHPCAIEAGNTDVVRLLIDAGADVGKADPHGWSPLHSAAFSGDMGALLLALQRAKHPSPKDEYGWTPLDLAAFYRHEDIVKILDPDGKVTEFAWSHRSSKSSVSATHHYVPPMEDSAVTGYAEAPGSAR